MSVPKTPQERFQYYYDIANNLDAEYESKINKVSSGRFKYKPEKTQEYKQEVADNAAESAQLIDEYRGKYSEYSQGYDNSMQDLAKKNIKTLEHQKNKEFAKTLYDNKKQAWLAEKTRKIQSLKNMYAKEFGNAIYNMQKANEEISFNKKEKGA